VSEKKAWTLDELALFLRPEGVRLLDLAGRKLKAGSVCLRFAVKLWSPPILAEPFVKLAVDLGSMADIDPGSVVCLPWENIESRVLSLSLGDAEGNSTTSSSSLSESVISGSLATTEDPSIPNENGFKNFIPFSFETSPARLKRHLGTLARAIPHLSTCPQLIRTPTPPPQRSAFKIIFCGDEAKSSNSIKDIERSCNSAGRRLVVVRWFKVMHNA
jgi:hypothetical protein